MKKGIVLMTLLLAVMLVFAACGSGTGTGLDDGAGGDSQAGAPDAPGSAGGDQGEPYTIKMAFPVNTTPKDMQPVVDEINNLALQKTNTKIDVLPISFGQYEQQINLMISSNEKLDLMVQFGRRISSDAAKGSLIALDDLLENYGQGIVEAAGPYVKGGEINGEIYAVPSIRDMAAGYGIVMRRDILEKYGLKAEDVKTTGDIENMFKTVKADEPDLIMTMSQGSTLSMVDQLLLTYDGLGDGFGVLTNKGQDDLQVVNWYETEHYSDAVHLMRKWYNEGYILPDLVTNKEPAANLLKADKVFSVCSNLKPGYAQQLSRQSGKEMVMSYIVEPFSTTSQAAVFSWALPVNCENAEKTMQFLNLMYTDAGVVNLFDWGIEGRHYVKTADNSNVIDYPEGVDAINTGYGMNLGFMFGNQLISYVWVGDDPDLYKQLEEFNGTAKVSRALGFTFDSTELKNEIAALTNVQNQYKFALEDGAVDPVVNLPKFINDLKAAGIDKVIAAKQEQLDNWATSQGIK